jgi:hypothetical protein
MDVYTQKSMNLQIWNEEIELNRRYAIIKVDSQDRITKVKIISGEIIAALDNTGTLTTKYQAMLPNLSNSKLFSQNDTVTIKKWYCQNEVDLSDINPTSDPIKGKLLPIETIYFKLKELEKTTIPHIGSLQERNRGTILHQKICEKLGYKIFADKGTFPDILNQLIEVKLQTSPTIDLGLHNPGDAFRVFQYENTIFFTKDIRYVIFSGEKKDKNIKIKNMYISTGKDFTKHFNMFGGKVQNTKIQIPLPNDFFN